MRALSVLTLCVSTLLAGHAAAQSAAPPSEEDEARARALFEEGVVLSREERWSEALDAFRASRAIASRPSTIYNIATALQRLGRAIEAIETVQEYLAASDPVEHAEQRAQAEEMRDLLYSTLVRLTVAVTPETAELSVDGRIVPSLGAQRDIVLDPGDHVLTATASGHVTARLRLALPAGARETRQLALDRMPEQPAHLIVRTSPADAEVSIDDVQVGRGDGDVDVTAGRHLVRVRAERHRELRRIVVVAPGERLQVDAHLASASGPTSILEEPAFWIVVASVVAVGAAAGVTAGVLAVDAPYEGTAGFTLGALRF